MVSRAASTVPSTLAATALALCCTAVAAGCGEASNDAAPEIAAPAWDASAAPRAIRNGNDIPPLKGLTPLTMSVDAAQTKLVNAIFYADGGALRFAASAGNQLSCDELAPAWGVHYVSGAVDPGPKGTFWLGDPTPLALIARVPYDTQSARDIHPSGAKVQIGTAAQAAQLAEGVVPQELTLTIESRRTLPQPGTNPSNILNVSGQVTAFVCPSAAELLATAHRARPEPPTGWAHVEIDDRSFDVKSVLAMSADDGKNGPSITSLVLYAAEGARCDDGTRPLHDNGGGINGLQVEVGALAVPASRPTWGFTQPVTLDVTDVTAGRGAFAQVFLTKPSVPAHVHVGEVDYKIDPNRDEAGSLYGWIRASRDTPQKVRVEGRFTAKICRKPQ